MRLPLWIIFWLVVSQLVVLWDSAFVLLRPDSLPGGKYSALFSPCKALLLVLSLVAAVIDHYIRSFSSRRALHLDRQTVWKYGGWIWSCSKLVVAASFLFFSSNDKGM